jgi:hypothetical protein
MDLLRKHPATVARLFEIKQGCEWKNILNGTNKPIGAITDYWRQIGKQLYNTSYQTVNSQ